MTIEPVATDPVRSILEALPKLPDVVEGHSAILLPEEFWAARPILAHIRQAAHNRGRSADVVLHAVLARVAGAVPHTLKLPPIVGSRAPLCYFAAVVGPAASGKSSGVAIAAELLPVGADVADQLPVGSGEGLVEALFDLVREPDPETGKQVSVKRQVKFNAIVYIDEGDALTALSSRSGSTTLATFRSIWSGQTLGQTNASAERKRLVPAGQYTYGLIVGLQPALAGPLLDDVTAGTPQRFGWCWGIDPSIPDQAPEWPGELSWEPPDPARLAPLRSSAGAGFVTHELPVGDGVATEIRTRALARVRGEVDVDPHEAHGDLLRLKVAALLALLDARVEVTEDDWHLAEILTTTSSAVRRHTQGIVDAEARDRELATSTRLARRQVAAASAVESDQVQRTAERVATIVRHANDGITVAHVRRRLSRRQAEVFEEALALAVERVMVVEIDEPGQGSDKRTLRTPERG